MLYPGWFILGESVRHRILVCAIVIKKVMRPRPQLAVRNHEKSSRSYIVLTLGIYKVQISINKG